VFAEAAPRVWISFDLVSLEHDATNFDPDFVTEQLGIEPTQTNRVGDPISDRGGRRSFTRWRLSVGPIETINISPMLSELMTRLRPASPRLDRVCKELGIEPKLTCAVEPKSAETPDITFPLDVIRWAAANGVSIGVDLMLWREDGQDWSTRELSTGADTA
jgi:Domain of unknown function (DUF4279)